MAPEASRRGCDRPPATACVVVGRADARIRHRGPHLNLPAQHKYPTPPPPAQRPAILHQFARGAVGVKNGPRDSMSY